MLKLTVECLWGGVGYEVEVLASCFMQRNTLHITACVTTVSVAFSAHSRNFLFFVCVFLLFRRTKMGRVLKMEGVGRGTLF